MVVVVNWTQVCIHSQSICWTKELVSGWHWGAVCWALMPSSSDLLTLAVRIWWWKADRTEESLSPDRDSSLQHLCCLEDQCETALFSPSPPHTFFPPIVFCFVCWWLFLWLLFSGFINKLMWPPCALLLGLIYLFSSQLRTRIHSMWKSASSSLICVGSPEKPAHCVMVVCFQMRCKKNGWMNIEQNQEMHEIK